MSFGSQWLNDWESEREERLSVPVAHFKTASPTEPIPAFDFVRTEPDELLSPKNPSKL